jgi:hypothetical protein
MLCCENTQNHLDLKCKKTKRLLNVICFPRITKIQFYYFIEWDVVKWNVLALFMMFYQNYIKNFIKGFKLEIIEI